VDGDSEIEKSSDHGQSSMPASLSAILQPLQNSLENAVMDTDDGKDWTSIFIYLSAALTSRSSRVRQVLRRSGVSAVFAAVPEDGTAQLWRNKPYEVVILFTSATSLETARS